MRKTHRSGFGRPPIEEMPAFPPTILPDDDLEALIAYLKQIASQPGR